MSAWQPHQLLAYVPSVWHPAAQWQRGRQLQNPVLESEVQFPRLAGKQELNLSLIDTTHAFSIFTPSLAQLWKTKYSNTPEEGAELRAQSSTMEEPGGTGMTTGWAVNCSVTPCCKPCLLWGRRGVWAPWCEWEMVWATGAVLLWPAAVPGSKCPTLRQSAHLSQPSHGHILPGWSWKLLHRVSHGFC